MLRTRLKTALLALPILLALITLAPPYIFTPVIALLVCWGLLEIGEMTAVGDASWLVLLLAGGIPAGEMLWNVDALPAGPMVCLIVFVLLMMLVVRVGIGGAD
ncbi:MAG: hypothetical protein JO166_14450, partial [Deltaproteobacteria bacterium]|nr:hypothetical protein [Deltaproteobacteria bacterium]